MGEGREIEGFGHERILTIDNTPLLLGSRKLAVHTLGIIACVGEMKQALC